MNNGAKDDPFEDELDAIRVKLYERTKGMNASEVTAYIKEQIAPAVEKYHIPSLSETKSARAREKKAPPT